MDHENQDVMLSAAARRRLIAGLFSISVASHCADAAVAPPPLVVDDGDTYDFYVADQQTYDSNLYRLSPDLGNIATLVAPDASRADRINTASVGADGQWILGRQVIDFNLHADENRFSHNDALNNTSGYGHALWNWQVGGYFSGQVGVNYDHALASFAETRELGRDLTNTERYFGTARYQVGPHWALYGGVSDLTIDHSASQAKFNNFRLKQGDGGLEYASNTNDTLALEYSYSGGTFPSNNTFSLNGISFTPSYHEDLARVILKYSFSDKTQLESYAGYRRRTFTNVDIGGFSGDVWRVALNWQPSDKTQLVVAGWHELRAYLVTESDYFVSRGGSISPVWNATEKLNFALVFSFERQGYVPQSTSVIGQGPLNARVTTEQANITFSPRRAWICTLIVNHQKRDSNRLSYLFDDKLATASVLYRIH